MDTYDVIMIVVLAGATIIGAWKGMAWQVASLASIFVSYFVAYQFRGAVAAFIDATPPWNIFLAMLILYVATSLVIWVIFRLVAEFIDRLKLKEFDHQLGAVIGAAKGVVLCVLITLFAVTLLNEPQARQVIDSRSGYYIAVLLNRAHPVMPLELHDALEPYIHSLDERLDDKAPDYHAHEERNTMPAAIPSELGAEIGAQIGEAIGTESSAEIGGETGAGGSEPGAEISGDEPEGEPRVSFQPD